MSITAITSIHYDRDEYSLYYRQSKTGQDLSIINGIVAATGANGDAIYLSLVSQLTGRIISTQASTLNNGTASFRFNLSIDGYDSDGIFRAKHGFYTLIASTLPSAMGLTAVSKNFTITPISALEFREVWLMGIPLINERSFTPTIQGMTGVTGIGVRDVQRGGYTLQWNAASRLISWNNGPLIPVVSSGFPYTAILWPETLDQTLSVTIDPANMPTVDTSAYVFVDYDAIDDTFLRSQLNLTLGTIESYLNVPLEPTLVATEGFKSKYPLADHSGFAPTFKPSYSISRPMQIQLPMRRVIKIHGIGGYQGLTPVLNVPDGAVQLDSLNGIVSIVPSFSGQFPAPTAIGLGGVAFYGGNYNSFSGNMPNYWQYAATYGLDSMEIGNEAIAREAAFRRAAINVLGLIGRARTDILAGESFGRDGGSLSRQYTNGQYGTYSDLIMAHKEWLQENGGRHLKEQLIGIQVSVAGR